MITFFVCLAYVAFGALMAVFGFAGGFMYALRGTWAELFDRIVPPRSQGQMRTVLKMLVNAKQLGADAAALIEYHLYKQAQDEERAREWAEQQNALTARDVINQMERANDDGVKF